MQEFKDSFGQAWQVRISYETLNNINAQLGVNLANVVLAEQNLPMLMDPLFVSNALWVINERAARKGNKHRDKGEQITQSVFCERILFEEFQDIRRKFTEELANFFLKIGIPKMAEAIEEMENQVQAQLSDGPVDSTPKDTPTVGPASSSIPTGSVEQSASPPTKS